MADENPDPHILAPGRAPTPFTADQIRDASKPGKAIRRLVEAEGETPFHLVSRYVECDETGATMERSQLSLDGSPLGELDCLRYTVRDGATEEVFWFATSLPGMPIQQQTRTDGHVVETVSVVEYQIA